jgi:hypothetical protein
MPGTGPQDQPGVPDGDHGDVVGQAARADVAAQVLMDGGEEFGGRQMDPKADPVGERVR